MLHYVLIRQIVICCYINVQNVINFTLRNNHKSEIYDATIKYKKKVFISSCHFLWPFMNSNQGKQIGALYVIGCCSHSGSNGSQSNRTFIYLSNPITHFFYLWTHIMSCWALRTSNSWWTPQALEEMNCY